MHLAAGKPHTVEEALGALPGNVEVVIGEPSESCTAACARSQRACSSTDFLALNGCNQLRQRFRCEAGCGVRLDSVSVPGYITSTADRGEQPTFCWISQPGSTGVATQPSTCEASTPSFQRLCPCAGSLLVLVPEQAAAQGSDIVAQVDATVAGSIDTKAEK